MSQEEENQKRLEAQREADEENNRARETSQQKKSLRKLASEIAREAGVTDTEHLRKFIRLIDIFFAVAIMTSLLKDIFDFLGNAIPYLYLICVVFAFMASIVTWAAMLICGAGLRQHKRRSLMKSIFTRNKLAILFAGTILEILPILNFFPIETVTTFAIFILILKERRESAAEEERETAQLANVYAQI
ncbi:MAG: hypothetical protein NTY33_02455 [Candidatus Moranbacteria bacterium]|nr:hypothetical protein [Candidatus Moranbacteria bacterium]